jgi:branched-chain amino acid transport system substrate-binding protein
MHKLLRLSAVLTAMALIMAACASNNGGTASSAASSAASAAASAAGSMAEDPTTVCAADKFGCVEYAPSDPINLGLAAVISGANSSLGLDQEYGVKVALALRPKVAGHDVKLTIADSGCSADGGTQAANQLKADPSIVAVVGTSCSSAGVKAAEILSGAGILIVSPSNTAPSLTDPATHQPFYARTAHNDKVQGAAMAEFACTVLKVSTAATIHDGSPYAEQLQQVFKDNFASKCNGTATDTEAITVGQTDFNAVLTKIGATNPQLLYYPIFVAEGALITQQAKQIQGLANTQLAGADGLLTPDFLSAAGSSAEGMVLSGPDLAFSGTFYEQTFLPKYKEISGSDQTLSVFHAHAYDAANMIFDAIEKVAITDSAGNLYIPRTALRDAFFATSGYQGITGTLSCDANGDCANPKISVSKVENGKFVRIWPTS